MKSSLCTAPSVTLLPVREHVADVPKETDPIGQVHHLPSSRLRSQALYQLVDRFAQDGVAAHRRCTAHRARPRFPPPRMHRKIARAVERGACRHETRVVVLTSPGQDVEFPERTQHGRANVQGPCSNAFSSMTGWIASVRANDDSFGRWDDDRSDTARGEMRIRAPIRTTSPYRACSARTALCMSPTIAWYAAHILLSLARAGPRYLASGCSGESR